MDRMIYTAMNGASQSFDQQAVVGNNLANVSTPGFRAQLSAMQSVPVEGDGVPTRTLPLAVTPGADMTTGPISATSRALDFAYNGNAWIAVQAKDGSEAYTRRGDVQVDKNGMLNIGGMAVIGDAGPILVPLDSQVSVGSSGTISVIEAGQKADSIAEVARVKLVTAGRGQLERSDDGLFRAPADANGVVQPLPADETARLTSGALEGSNVNPTSAMVDMINSQRRYEMQMKVISSAEENEKSANGLLAIR